MRTYRVIPYTYLEGPEGQKASLTGAKPPGYVAKTQGFTVEVTSRSGEVTRGIYSLRVPASHRDATEAALQAARATGGKFIREQERDSLESPKPALEVIIDAAWEVMLLDDSVAIDIESIDFDALRIALAEIDNR